MPDWDAERRVLRLKEYAHSNQALDSDVLSLKFRFLSKPERDGQLYLGGHEYQVIDEAFERSGLEGRTLRRSKPRKYNRHESGPEILSFAADVIGIASGAALAWTYIKDRISRARRAHAHAFQGAKYLSVEVRAIDEKGELREKRMALIALTDELDQAMLEKNLQTALKPHGKRQRG
jgi:hypothetical protein